MYYAIWERGHKNTEDADNPTSIDASCKWWIFSAATMASYNTISLYKTIAWVKSARILTTTKISYENFVNLSTTLKLWEKTLLYSILAMNVPIITYKLVKMIFTMIHILQGFYHQRFHEPHCDEKINATEKNATEKNEKGNEEPIKLTNKINDLNEIQPENNTKGSTHTSTELSPKCDNLPNSDSSNDVEQDSSSSKAEKSEKSNREKGNVDSSKECFQRRRCQDCLIIPQGLFGFGV